MKNVIKKIMSGMAGLLAVFVLASCSDVDSPKSNEINGEGYKVSGSVTISGAAPSELLSSKDETSRTATSSLSDDVEWTIYAKKNSTKNEGATSADADASEPIEPSYQDGGNFAFIFEEKGTYEVYANLNMKSEDKDITVFTGEKTVYVSDISKKDGYEISIEATFLDPLGFSGKGSIDLPISVDSGLGITKLIVSSDSFMEFDIPEPTCTFENNSTSINISEIPYGEHTATLSFYDSSNNLVYRCTELINVYPGFTTDTWYGTSPYITNGDFRLTEAVVNKMEKVEDFSTPVVLWNGRTEEQVLNAFTDDAGYTTSEVENFSLGTQIFAKISGNEVITAESQDEYGTPTFCFGDDCIYQLVNGTIVKYLTSYCGIVKDESFTEIDVNNLIMTKIEPSTTYVSVGSLCYYKEKLYISVVYDLNSANTYLVCALSPDSPNDMIYGTYSNPETYFTAMALYNNGTQYVLFGCDGTTIYKMPFTLTSTEIQFGTTTNLDIRSNIPYKSKNMDDGTEDASVKINIGDLQIIDNTLYVAVYAYTTSIGPYTDAFFGDSHIRKGIVISNGGIAKIDLTKTTFALSTWENGEEFLGLYKDNYYYKDEDEKYLASDYKVIMQPPLEQAGSYFYGARKFIAKKPDELVIADDGIYIDGEYVKNNVNKWVLGEDVECQNKNRVVTVNLKDESISAVDVGVCFSATLVAESDFGVGD